MRSASPSWASSRHGFDLVAVGDQLRGEPRRRHHLLGHGVGARWRRSSTTARRSRSPRSTTSARLRPGRQGRGAGRAQHPRARPGARRARQRQRAGGLRSRTTRASRSPAWASGSTRTSCSERVDPRGIPYYWFGGPPPSGLAVPGTDFHAVVNRRISVTPHPARPHRPAAPPAAQGVGLGSRPRAGGRRAGAGAEPGGAGADRGRGTDRAALRPSLGPGPARHDPASSPGDPTVRSPYRSAARRTIRCTATPVHATTGSPGGRTVLVVQPLNRPATRDAARTTRVRDPASPPADASHRHASIERGDGRPLGANARSATIAA